MKRIKDLLMAYFIMLCLIFIGHITKSLPATIVFVSLGFFWSFITSKEDK